MVFNSWESQRFATEDHGIPILPYKVAKSTEGEPSYFMIKALAGEKFLGPGENFIPTSVPPR